jgi:hypothetical protein
MVAGQPVRQPKNGGAMALHKNAKSVAIAGKRALDSNGVGCPDALNAFVHSYP